MIGAEHGWTRRRIEIARADRRTPRRGMGIARPPIRPARALGRPSARRIRMSRLRRSMRRRGVSIARGGGERASEVDHPRDRHLRYPETMRTSARVLLATCASVLLFACSGSSSAPAGPSCKSIPARCADLPQTACVQDYGCSPTYSCAGTASCEAALTSSGSRYPDMNCRESSPGCTWTGTTCTGTPLPCTDSMYQANSVACENVGCVLTIGCTGGTASFDCGQEKTEADCASQSGQVCAWQ